MSLDNVKKFKEAAAGDAALKGKVNSALSKTEPEKHAELLSELASEAGYPFTAEEYREALLSAQAVNDDDLDAVSGGKDVRNWLKDGCTATVEPGSWCWSDDWCVRWDSRYDTPPIGYCPECGGMMYHPKDSDYNYCATCGYKERTGGPCLA